MSRDDPAWDVEEACCNGFPALRQVLCAGWLVRVSGSTRRTANSATPLRQGHGNPETMVAGCEAICRRHGQKAIFRIPSYLDPEIDRRLAARGYTDEGHSCVIHGRIETVAGAADPAGVPLLAQPTDDWFAEMTRLQGQAAAEHAAYRRVLASIMVPAAFAAVEAEGRVAAMAFGVIHRGLICYESVVTDPEMRRRGHARRVLAALATWAQEQGATGACLQVEAANAPGRALYDALGMTTELHRYHYRRQPG